MFDFKLSSPSSAWKSDLQRSASAFTPVITRTAEERSFDFCEMAWDMSSVLPPETRFLSGLHRFGETMKKFEPTQLGDVRISAGWMLFRLAPRRFFLVGVASWRVFPAAVLFHRGTLSVRFCGAGKSFAPGESLPLEDVFCGLAESEQEAFDAYTDFIVRNVGIHLNLREWRGWGDWDYYTGFSNEQAILENLAAIKQTSPAANLVQIDDGYCRVYGDWMEVNPEKFPNGLAPIVTAAKARGMEVGIWIAPFYAHFDSNVVKRHPEWFQHRKDGSLRNCGTLSVAIMDYSQEEPLEYLRQCVRYCRGLGISYFKLDFVNAGAVFGKAAVPMTPFERIHRCLSAFREAAGPDAYLLGGSTEFGPCLGHIDGQRIGPDVAANFPAVRFAVASDMASLHYHRRIFQCDPDYLVVRGEKMNDDTCVSAGKHGDLTTNEAKLWADFVAFSGNARLNSDKLTLLTPERRRLVADALGEPRENHRTCVLDYWRGGTADCPAVVYSDGALGVFNLHDKEQEFALPSGEKRTLPPHTSLVLTHVEWDGRQLPDVERPLLFENPLGQPFQDGEAAVPLAFGAAANSCAGYDFEYGSEVLEDVYSPLCGAQTLLGVPLLIDRKVITLRSDANRNEIAIPVGRNVSALYFLHAAAYPVAGDWVDYTVVDEDGTETVHSVAAGRDIGNTDYQYTPLAADNSTRLAWHDDAFVKGAYLMELKFTGVRAVREIRVSKPKQTGMHILLAVSATVPENPPRN